MATDRRAGGLVVLVGAGPGEQTLATSAAAMWISRADVIIYDRLVPTGLLDRARADAERLHVGKTPGRPSPAQDEISALLIRHARAGRLVVRVKGGDPLVFGRGGEEAEALADAGVPFRIVPGVTAAVAAAAYAGIPLTDRRHGSSVAFVTGRQDPAKAGTTVNWPALAGIDTNVFYMGVGSLGEIVRRLIEAGRDPSTPAAIVAAASTPRQRVVTARLAELAAAATKAGVEPPALTIVGEVTALHQKLAWFEKLPLFGQTVVVTRPAHQAGDLAAQLGELGAAVVEAPAIEIRPPADAAAVDSALRRLGRFHLVVFTSVNGVEAFVRRCRELGLDGRALASAKVAAVGSVTAEALRQSFIRPDIVPHTFTTEALAAAIRSAGDLAGKRALLARADLADPQLAHQLRSAGAEVEEVAFYRTVRPERLPGEAIAAIRQRRADWVTFASSSAVRNFVALLGREAAEMLGQVKHAAIGPVTAETLTAAGLKPTVVAEEHTIEGLVDAIVRHVLGGE